MLREALEARLQVLEQEILRLTQLAAQEKETEQQDKFWQLAQDLQREARQIRSEIARMTGSANARKGNVSQPTLIDTKRSEGAKNANCQSETNRAFQPLKRPCPEFRPKSQCTLS
jgi:hypothetical protein